MKVPIESITLDPENKRRHDEKNLRAIARSLERFGQQTPIVIDADGRCLKGNGTVLAAKDLGWKEIDATRSKLKGRDADAYAVADNRAGELATWEQRQLAQFLEDMHNLGDLECTGFEEEDLDELLETLAHDALAGADDDDGEDEAPETPDEPTTRRGDLWSLGAHRLLCGDAGDGRDVSRLLGGGRPDAIFTDPPYGIGIDGQKASECPNPKHNRKGHEFRGWDTQRPGREVFDTILAFGVPSAIFGGNYFADLLPATRGWLYWSKGQDGLTMSDGELAWTSEDSPLRCITVNRGALQGSVHPTQKPLKVVQFALDYIKAGSVVLDLFGGSGSTLITCERTGRSARVMELDPAYCDVIVRRWEEATGRKAGLGLAPSQA